MINDMHDDQVVCMINDMHDDQVVCMIKRYA